MRIRDMGALGDQYEVAEQGEAAAEADSGPVHRRDDRERAAHHAEDDPPGLVDVLLPEGGVPLDAGHDLEVAARAERPAAPGEYDHPRVRIGRHVVPDRSERRMELLTRRVELIRPVQLDQPDRPVGRHHEIRHRHRPALRKQSLELNAITI
jgi:hypothetical protein